jgi:hypothetical protein
MPRVALGVLVDAVNASSRHGWEGPAWCYAEGQVDAEGCPRRSLLYADGPPTPTVAFRSCSGEAVRPRPSAYTPIPVVVCKVR